jgi:hypothetical protein
MHAKSRSDGPRKKPGGQAQAIFRRATAGLRPSETEIDPARCAGRVGLTGVNGVGAAATGREKATEAAKWKAGPPVGRRPRSELVRTRHFPMNPERRKAPVPTVKLLAC